MGKATERIPGTIMIAADGGWTFGEMIRAGYCYWTVHFLDSGSEKAKIISTTETTISGHEKLDRAFAVPKGATHYTIEPGFKSLGDKVIHKIVKQPKEKEESI